MKVTVTDADYEQAMMRLTLDGKRLWAELKQQARRLAAERMLDANSKRQKELIAANKGLVGGGIAATSKWHANEDELTRLFEEHAKLLDIAYPESTAAALAERRNDLGHDIRRKP